MSDLLQSASRTAAVSSCAIVADDQLAAHFDAQRVQLIGDEQRIGVDALGVSNSDPTAMISASASLRRQLKRTRPALDADVHAIQRVVGGQDQGSCEGENARPTMAGPERNNSACASGVMRTTPRRPPRDAATYRLSLASNAMPCGRPRPR